MIYFLLFLFFTSLNYGAEPNRKTSFSKPNLSLDLDLVSLQDEKSYDHQENASRSDKYDQQMRRTLSRTFSLLVSHLNELQGQNQPKQEEFYELCYKVTTYQKDNLDALVHNQLLYDEGHDLKINFFNIVLLAGLRKIAKEHKFSDELIPYDVVNADDYEKEEVAMDHSETIKRKKSELKRAMSCSDFSKFSYPRTASDISSFDASDI